MSDDVVAAIREAKVESSYKRARIYAKILLWSLGFFVIGICFSVIGEIVWELSQKTPSPIHPDSAEPWWVPDIEQLAGLVPIIIVSISFFTLIASAIGATSTILLGWHAERQQSQEFKLKIKQLELQLQEARSKIVSPAKDTIST
jgi:hypothetical protein